MWRASVLKLVNQQNEVVAEEDFDSALEGGLTDIYVVLPSRHTFYRLMFTLDVGTKDKEVEERVGTVASEEAQETAFLVITPEQLAEFADYLHADVDRQWDELFPGKGPGVWGWVRYHIWQKSVERQYKAKPSDPNEVWYKEVYVDLLQLLRKAVDQNCCVLRERY